LYKLFGRNPTWAIHLLQHFGSVHIGHQLLSLSDSSKVLKEIRFKAFTCTNVCYTVTEKGKISQID